MKPSLSHLSHRDSAGRIIIAHRRRAARLNLSEIVIGSRTTDYRVHLDGEPVAHAASSPPPHTTDKQQTFCCNVALVLSTTL